MIKGTKAILKITLIAIILISTLAIFQAPVWTMIIVAGVAAWLLSKIDPDDRNKKWAG